MRIYEANLSYKLVSRGQRQRLDNPKLAADYLQSAFDTDPTVEWFFTILLGCKNHPLGRVMISKGVMNTASVHPREVYKAAIIGSASAIIIAHNHHSGDPTPSQADIRLSKREG